MLSDKVREYLAQTGTEVCLTTIEGIVVRWSTCMDDAGLISSRRFECNCL